MFKKSLLLTLLLALLVPWAANGQGTLPIGTGTSYSASGSSAGVGAGSPMGNTYYYNSAAQFIYTASELGGAKTINSLAFYHNASSFSANVKIYLDHTTASTVVGTSPATTGTLVYDGSGITLGGSSADWQTFTFDSNFEYNGTDNLLVVVCRTNYSNGWSGSQGWQYSTTSDNKFMVRSSDTGAYGDITNTSYDYTASTNRPNVTIGYALTTPYITLDPTSTTVITGFTKDLTATAGNVTGTPTITYSSSNSKVASVTGSGTSATVTGVAPGTCTITATMTYNATDYTATCDVTVEDPSYCEPEFSSSASYNMYITNFTTDAGINNSTGFSTGGYGDYYDTQASEIEAGETLNFSVSQGSSYAFGYAIWVDWNNDYEFSSDERVAATSATITTSWSGSFTVASTTPTGDYRMRVLAQYYTASPSDPCISTYYGEGEDYKLKVAAFNPYQKPENLQVSELAATSATITWEAPNSDVLSYKYQYQPQGGEWTTLKSTTSLSAPLTALTSSTLYNFQVKAIYAGDNESNFASTTFTTPHTIPYTYGFETADDMDFWEQVDCELANGYFNTSGNEYSRTGDGCYYFSSYNGSTDPQYLISPQLSGIANGLHVSFYYRSLQDDDPETFMVGYSTTDTDPDSFTWSDEVTSPDGSYYPYAVNFMVPSIKYVAIKYTSGDSFYLFVDDITFEEAPDCLEPTNVDAINITTTTADITWTNGGDESEWDIFVTDDSTIEPDGTTTPTVEGVTTKPHQLTLQPGTTYYVYVRSACSSTETSAWSSPKTFHTDCEGMDLPYGPYGFEDGALTVCWNWYSNNIAYNTVSVYNGSESAHTGTKSLRFYRGSTTGDLVLALPVIDDSYDLSEYQFEFWAYATGATLKMTVGIMDDPNNLTTFVAQGAEFSPATSYTEYKVRFNEYTGNGKFVAIRVSSTASGSIYMDDIAINPIPSCIEPSALAVSDETAHGATFGWTAGGSETEWHLYFGKDNTAPADDIDLGKVTVADSNPFTLTTGLDAETEYYVWVRANCGGTDGNSIWVGPKTFTTGIACPAPTGLAYSEVTNHTAKLSWTGTSESYVLSVGTYDYTATPITGTILEEGFESTSMPEGWTHIGNGSAAPSTSYTHAGSSRSLEFKSATSNNVVVLPQFAAEPNQLTIDFWSRAESSTLSQSGYFDLGYVTNASDASTFVALETYSAEDHGSAYVHIENYSLSSVPDGARIAFRHRSGLTYYYWYIDDVTITGPTYPIAWDTYNTTDTQKTVEGLDPETQYFAKVKGNCGSEGYSQETAVISFTTDIACPAPTGLTATNPKSSAIDLSWTNGGAENWVLAYKKTTDTDFTEVALASPDVTETAGVISYTLGGLDPETNYTVKVRDNCEPSYTGDGQSEWTAEVPYSTIAACSAMDPVVSNITHHNATVTWDGESASGFTVNYREAAHVDGISEEFSSSSAPNGWTRYSGEWKSDGTGPTSTTSSGWNFGAKNFTNSHAYMNMYSTWKYWLVTPSITVGSNYVMNFDAAYTKYDATTTPDQNGTDDRFIVLISTDNKAHWTSLREWNNAGTGDAVLNDLPVTFEPVDPIDLSAYVGQTVYIAFYGASTESNTDNHLRIDNVIIGVNVPAATTWQTKAATSTTADLTGLTAGTKYDLKVVPNCDETLESATVQFSTVSPDSKWFITAGDWSTAANWEPTGAPTINQSVTLYANVTIESGCVAEAKTITQGTHTITIEDGGQLKHDNSGVTATVKKHIIGYGAGNTDTKLGYYLISNPLYQTINKHTSSSTPNISSTNMLTGTYDFYNWSNSNQGAEWRNYETSAFDMSYSMYSYLYANEADVDLTFTGTLRPSNSSVSRYLTDYSSSYTFGAWYLLGNPFVCNAYLVNASTSGTALPYYRMDAINGTFEAVTSGPIAPMEGIFYEAETSGNVYMVRTAPTPSLSAGNGNLNINIAQVVNSRDAHRSTDNAIIRFDGGQQLGKFSFNENNAKVYIPQEGKDYAVVNAENAGEMPVNFKAAENGSYTISFTAEDVNFSYLHLIDNLTGNDVNLLETPSYSFDARTTDYASRFKLVFAKGNADMGDDFGFFDASGNLLVLGIEGKATLQLIDVTGRILSSETFSGNYSKAINASAGVYMLRLIQGNDVRTQKIVVK